MTISKHVVSAELNVGEGHELDVVDSKITLDDAWAPFAQAELTIHTPDETVLDLLDPRDNVRVVVTTTKEFGDWNPSSALTDQERVFNLLLRSREVDHVTGTTDLSLASDEATLQDYALVATESERIYGLSVKDAVEYALAKVSATLEAGAADADIEASPAVLPAVTNLLSNPSFETNTTGWGNRSGTSSFVRTSDQALFGTYALSFKLTTTSGTVWANDYIATTLGSKITWSFYIRSTIARDIRATLGYYNSSNVQVGFDDGSNVTVSTSEWTRVTVTGTVAGTGASKVRPVVVIVSGTTTETYYVDGGMLVQSEDLSDYFDGDTTDTGFDTYAWDGTDHASTSVHTNMPNSDAMIWQPGVTAWDWLEPLLQATGLRLFCDETRKWWLETSGTTREGVINIAADRNATQARDKISRTSDSWFDAVVIAYTDNTDENGKAFTIYDVTDPGTLTLKLEYDRPYPGPGAAAAVLNRAQGRGRVLNLEAVNNYDATPGMAIVATLPDSPIQSGVISSVQWSFPDDRMTLGSRGLTDTPESSWLFAPEGLAWEDIPVGVDWTEYNPDDYS